MCATHPVDGRQLVRAIQDVCAEAPYRFSAYLPLKSSAQAGPADDFTLTKSAADGGTPV